MRSNEWLGVLKSCTGPTGLVSTLLPAQTHSKPELNEHTIKKTFMGIHGYGLDLVSGTMLPKTIIYTWFTGDFELIA